MTISRKPRGRRHTARDAADREIAELRRSFHGSLLMAGDTGYDAARRVWNGMIDRNPVLIARCRSTADVKSIVHFARVNGLDLSIRGGGHNVSGSAIADDGVVIDLSAMREVAVDPDNRLVEAYGGAMLGDIDRATQIHGLAMPSGLISNTGIAGLALRGGYGHLTRQYGLTCDNLVAVKRTCDHDGVF